MTQTIGLTPYKPDPLTLEEVDAEVVAKSEFPVQVTERALSMVRAAIKETEGEDGEFLRVGVKGGGCAGFQYSLAFTNEVDEEDIIADIDGVGVVTDFFSASYLTGTELDYVESLQGAGFKFINPNAKRTCGCGSSFS